MMLECVLACISFYAVAVFSDSDAYDFCILFSSHQDAHSHQNQRYCDRLNITPFTTIDAILAS